MSHDPDVTATSYAAGVRHSTIAVVRTVPFSLDTVRRVMAPAVALALLVSLWALVVWAWQIPPYIVPGPDRVGHALLRTGWGFLPDTWTTLQEVLAGFALGLVAGVSLSLILPRSLLLRTSLYPLLIGSQLIPIFVVSVVVTIMFVNDGLLPQIVVTALYSFLPFVVTGSDALSRTDPDMLKVVRSSGASQWRILRTVEFPAALPALFSAAKMAMIFAVGGALISEWIGGGSGLGYYMRTQDSLFLIDNVFAAVVVVTALGAVLFLAVSLVEYVSIPWARRESRWTSLWRA